MKKILFSLLIGGGVLALASCTKNYAVVPNQTVYADIKTSDWGAYSNGLTDTVMIYPQKGSNFGAGSDGILVYLTFDGGNTYEQIPYVFDNRNYSYVYDKGAIQLFVQSSDGTKPVTAPAPLTAKVILVPSN